ncbi:uncharacterized protein LOC135804937 [Sycon ciliatum]|uniref:uncharacterized protein LOC135804937 n=1 Tax=Sycon ciliatum TaxID=27933 RepID=UPI0031F64525
MTVMTASKVSGGNLPNMSGVPSIVLVGKWPIVSMLGAVLVLKALGAMATTTTSLGKPLQTKIAQPIEAIPGSFYSGLKSPSARMRGISLALINEAVMFRENDRSEYTPHLMYIYKKERNATTYLEVAVYDVSYSAFRTWQVFEREIDLNQLLGPKCCCLKEGLSIAVSPSKEQIILYGFGPGECNSLLLVYGNRKARVLKTHHAQASPPVGELGMALATIPARSVDGGNTSSSAYYLLSIGGCAWQHCHYRYSISRNYQNLASNTVHRLLMQDNPGVAAQWEFVDLIGPKRPSPQAFASLFAESDTTLLYVGGWKSLGTNASSTAGSTVRTVEMDIWRFDLVSQTWIELENTNSIYIYDNRRKSMFQNPSWTCPFSTMTKVSYIASQRKLLIQDVACSNSPCPLILCDIRERLAHCTEPIASTYSASLLHTTCAKDFFLSSGMASFFFASPDGKNMIEANAYSITPAQGNSAKHRIELHKVEITTKFPGFTFAGTKTTSPAIKVPIGSKPGEVQYVFFGADSSLVLQIKFLHERSPEYTFVMPVWMLRASTGNNNLSPFYYTLLYPKPGPAHPHRMYHSITLVTANTAIMYGGYDPSERIIDPFPWCFNVRRHFWTKASITRGTIPPTRGQHVSFRYNASAVVVHGGKGLSVHWDRAVLGDLWMFVLDDEDRCQGRWHNLTDHINKGQLPIQYGHTATPTDRGAVILYGGRMPGPSQLTLITIQSPSEVFIHDIAFSPSIPNRYHHSLSFSDTDLILMGGEEINSDGRKLANVDWALLIYFKTRSTVTVATWTRFFKTDIGAHTAVGSMMFGGTDDNRIEKHFSILDTTGLCPVGHERGFNNTCRPCPIEYYSATIQQQCIKCNQSLTTASVAATHCVPENPCKPHTCNQHGKCIVNDANFKHYCVCRFGYLSSDDCKTPSVYLALMAALVFAVTLTTLTIALIQFLKKRKALHDKEIELVNTNRDLYRSKRKLSQIDHGARIAWCDLRIKKQLATGRFCKVLLAELGDMTVIVKQLPPFVTTSSPYDAFIQEAEVLRTLRHPNIVMFMGAGKDRTSGRPFLVMEHLRRGSLHDVLHDHSNNIEHADRLRFSLDAARGVKYLHSTRPPRIHRDIKSANMLVSDKWVVKIADMETTRFLAILRASTSNEAMAAQQPDAKREVDGARTTSFTSPAQSDQLTTPLLENIPSTTTAANDDDDDGGHATNHGNDAAGDMEGMTSRIGMTCGVGTDRWRSPESIKKNIYTEKHDVYSYGVVMWELCTRQIPYAHLHNSDDILDEIASDSKLIFPPNIRYPYRHLAEQCTKSDPQERPSMHRIVQELTSQLDAT